MLATLVVGAADPVRVEYAFTSFGWSATELLLALDDWAARGGGVT